MSEEQEGIKLRDALAKFFDESGKGSLEIELKGVEDDVPALLRFLAEYYTENHPNARNEISVFEECADQLERLHLPEPPQDHWKWKESLGIA